MEIGFVIDPFEKSITAVFGGYPVYSAAIEPNVIGYSTLWCSSDGLSSVGLLIDDNGVGKPQQAYFKVPAARHRSDYCLFAGRAVLILDGDLPDELKARYGTLEALKEGIQFVTTEVAEAWYAKHYGPGYIVPNVTPWQA
jgi:hypothetical protein